MLNKKAFFILLLLAKPACLELCAQVKWVSPDDDVSSIIAEANPGDTILFLPGFYHGPIQISVNGDRDKPIVLMSESNKFDLFSTVDGGGIIPALQAEKNWLIINNSSWIELINLRFQNGWTDPISIKNSSYISFKSCFFSGGRKVITAEGLTAHHVLIENCYWDQGGRYLWNVTRWRDEGNSWDAMHHGSLRFFNGSLFASRGSAGGHVIRGNTIRHAFNGLRWNGEHNKDVNIEIYANDISYIRDNDFEPEVFATNLFIHHNSSHNIHKTLSIDNVNGGHIYYFGNTVTTDQTTRTSNIATGFYKTYGKDRNITEPLYIFNNSYYGTGKIHGSMNGRHIQNIVHYNNAFELTRRKWELDTWNQTMTYDYDCSNEPFSEILTNNGQEAHGIVASPEFQDPEHRDLTLMSSSPCLDAGVVVTIPELDWTQSFEGSAPEIGAYENKLPVTGPFFRVIDNDALQAVEELPRISQLHYTNEYLEISFSAPLDPSTVHQNVVFVYNDGSRETIGDFELINGNHTLRIVRKSDSKIPVSIDVIDGLTGANQLPATDWGNASKFNFESKDDVVSIVTMPLGRGQISITGDLNFYRKGAKVSIKAIPDEGYRFKEWSGDVTGTQEDITVTLNHSFWIIAHFEADEITGLDQLLEPLPCYPNPTHGRVVLPEVIDYASVEFIAVSDLVGHDLMLIDEIHSRELDLSGLHPGTYVLTIKFRDRISLHKIIINK